MSDHRPTTGSQATTPAPPPDLTSHPHPRRYRHVGRWVDSVAGRELAAKVCVADSFRTRLLGLQFLARMPVGDALWLRDCRAIHTAFMRFPIHVVFLDADFRIVDLRPHVPPWRVVLSRSRQARHVLEARELHHLAGITVGQSTRIEASGDGRA